VINAAEVDVTVFGSAGWTEVIGGLKSGQVSLDFHSDFGVGAVSTLFAPLVGTLGTVTIGASEPSELIERNGALSGKHRNATVQ
jgi:hypothetical protein